MKKGFVITENYRRLMDAQAAVEKRGAREAGLVIVHGRYGVGKSELVERWSSDNQALFLRCKETWTKRSLLDELADLMHQDKGGRNSEVQARIIRRLSSAMAPLVFDEADHLITKTSATLLEVVRDITDMTRTPCYLVGMESFGDALGKPKLGHIASRVNRVVELLPATLADVRLVCAAKAEVGIEPDLVEQIHRDSGGLMRLVLNAISNIEQWALANDWKSVNAAQVKGKPLVVEFRSTKRLGLERGAM